MQSPNSIFNDKSEQSPSKYVLLHGGLTVFLLMSPPSGLTMVLQCMGLHGMNAKEKTGWVVREYGKSKRKDKESQLNFKEQNGVLCACRT